MAHIEWSNSISRTNDNGHYYISIFHKTFETAQKIALVSGNEMTTEYYGVQYSWNNAKRSMHNITSGAFKTLEEAEKWQGRKVKDLDAKIA